MKRKQLLAILGVAGVLAGVYLAVRSPESIRALKQYASKPLHQGFRHALGPFGGKERVPGDSVSVMDPARLGAGEVISLFKDYLVRYAGSGAQGQERIDRIRASGAPLPSEDVQAIGNLIRSGRVKGQELASLIRLYGDQFVFNSSRREILEDIKLALQQTSDRDVGNAAMLTFSRLGPAEEVRELLTYSRQRDYISGNDYFGEIAHNLLRAESTTQAAWLQELVEAKNGYAREILADALARDAAVDSISAASAQKLLAYFKESETKFSDNPAEYGLFAAFDYEKWLAASAKLTTAAGNGGGGEQFILQTLLDKDLDPRKALSWFLAEERVDAFVNGTDAESRRALGDRLLIYSNKSSKSKFVFDFVQSLYPRLVNSKGAK